MKTYNLRKIQDIEDIAYYLKTNLADKGYDIKYLEILDSLSQSHGYKNWSMFLSESDTDDKISKKYNALNILKNGSAVELTDLIISLMGNSDNDVGMWKINIIFLISDFMRALVWLRDNDGLLLSLKILSEYFALENIQRLSKRRDIPPTITNDLRTYLISLIGHAKYNIIQRDIINEHHYYFQLQFSRALSQLEEI